MSESDNKQLLLVDDDQDLTAMLAEYLEAKGFRCGRADGGNAALAYLDRHAVDLIVMDVMMPGMSGLELLPQLRSRWSTPVIMLTGRGDDIDRIVGLEIGADDYLAKPCNPRELVARIQAVLRRTQSQSKPTDVSTELSGSGLLLNPAQRAARYAGQSLALTTAEFDLLEILLRHAGEAVSKDDLSLRVLQRELSPYDRSIDVHISRLRHKLKQAGASEDLIKTVRNQGYLLIRT